MSGLFHDLGKRKLSTKLLNFSGKLDENQFDLIKKHPQFGEELFCQCAHKEFDDHQKEQITRVIMEHHENVNGTGYPNGLRSKDISRFSKMVAITDFFDAITSYRSYHEPLSNADALVLMENSVGRKIDKKLFEKFKECVELPDDFDPCQPQNILPFKKREPEIIKEDIFNNKEKIQKKKKVG